MEQPSTNVIQKGRPSNKKASSQAKNNTKRDPSLIGSAHTGKEQTTQQSSTTSKRRTREPTKNIVCKRRRTILQLKDLTEEELFEEVLDLFDPKIKEHIIERLENVAPDGHCGYRCCAELLNMSKDDGWKNAFLKPNAPIPKVVPGWDHLRYPDANEWKNYVTHKFAEWEALIGYPPI
ncbi:hypothetical protein BVC80_8879g5 [Macleaya cordata]|uniref:Ovarian tumor n=1 Tax=Macleaya cordata TaxID=56857 RepID=A0A200QK30_MACCD|nr:hypothetical protein BVC80_8879g5 [Macleaya cordata]